MNFMGKNAVFNEIMAVVNLDFNGSKLKRIVRKMLYQDKMGKEK